MGGVVVFPLRVLRPGAHFGETPRARQPSGHLCDRYVCPVARRLRSSNPSDPPLQKAPEGSGSRATVQTVTRLRSMCLPTGLPA
jgi:hypothetical protein